MLSWAFEPFVISEIRVEGLQRVEPGTVFASIPLRVNETFTEDKGSASIRSLFGLGLFKDVRLEVEGTSADSRRARASHRSRCGFCGGQGIRQRRLAQGLARVWLV